PKLFGFTLNEKWGKRAFWCWIIGFFIAFTPLYFLGFMGMTRRLSQNIDSQFHFLLCVAALGAFLIGLGIICQVVQFWVSIRDRHKNIDRTGDPWDGRTLEWSVSSPVPFYNFAIIPIVKERDDFWHKKNILQENTEINYHSFHMPKNNGFGFLISLFALFFGFGAVWHIFWLCFLSLFAIIFSWI
ncbi:cbb3-type cytochrome c oxidase subunit I, partial [Buchnera aphidicola]|nr:cbb3-type cytochrome c oxidase subunit I [Buchnera aphidicola]